MEIIKILIVVNKESSKLGNLIYEVLYNGNIAIADYEKMKLPKYEFAILNTTRLGIDSLAGYHIKLYLTM